MNNLLVEFRLTNTQWGDVLFMRPIPRDGDPWGVLRCLEGTSWYDHIPVIPKQLYETALYGDIMPMMRVIGPPPRGICKKFPSDEGLCAAHHYCTIATQHCVPGPKLPDCFEPPLLEGDTKHIARVVALAWKEGRYVIVIDE